MTIAPPAPPVGPVSAAPFVQTAPTHMVVTPTKSVGIAILLTLVFGPLGLFYASIAGALAVLVGIPLVGAVAIVLLSSGGHPGFLLAFTLVPVMWVVALIWSVVAVNGYNARLLQPVR